MVGDRQSAFAQYARSPETCDLKPVIGITTYARNECGHFTLPGEYVDAVREAGGFPVLLTPGESDLERIIEVIDGFIFAGGGDVSPVFSGSGNHPAIGRVDEERDRFEIALAQRLLSASQPVLGVCRGMQLLNVATGGTLMAHVPEAVGTAIMHDGEGHTPVMHAVDVEPGSFLATMLGTTTPEIVSHHHQALAKVGEHWKVVAKTKDGIVEAMEHTRREWMNCVLWHPELSPSGNLNRKIFNALVSASKK